VAGPAEVGPELADGDPSGDPATIGARLGACATSVGSAAVEAAALGLGDADEEDAPRSPNGPAATTATIATSTRPATIRPRTAGLCHRIAGPAAEAQVDRV